MEWDKGIRIKKINLYLSLFVAILISSFCVFASDDAPPALPSEFWGDLIQNGNPVLDGLAVTAEVGGQDYAEASVTGGGMYDVMFVGGDRELTYNDDRDCSVHWAAGEACVPCDNESDCIEGPQDGVIVKIKVDDSGVMPYVEWLFGSNNYVETVTPIGDWNKVGCVDMADFGFFANHYGETPASPGWDIIYDLFRDDTVDMADFGIFANHYNEGC